jgi:hypothetical protein
MRLGKHPPSVVPRMSLRQCPGGCRTAGHGRGQQRPCSHSSGHLLMGRDETVTVLHQIASGHIFCDTFEVNTDGVARMIAGFYADTVTDHSEPQYIAKLNATEVENAISRAMSVIYWWSDQSEAFNPVQIERMRKTVRLLRAHEKCAPDESTSTGAVVRRSFIPNGSTTSVSPVLQSDAGWRHYPRRRHGRPFRRPRECGPVDRLHARLSRAPAIPHGARVPIGAGQLSLRQRRNPCSLHTAGAFFVGKARAGRWRRSEDLSSGPAGLSDVPQRRSVCAISFASEE